MLTVLDGQASQVRELVRGTEQVFGALTKDEGQLQNLIVNAGDTFAATARQQEALAQTFRIFPTFLDESELTFQRLESFSRDTDPLVQGLRPAAADLDADAARRPRAGAGPQGLLRQPRPADLRVEDRPARAARHADAGQAAARQLQPFLEQLDPASQYLEYQQLMTADFISNGAAALADTIPTVTDTEMGHYLRQFGPIGPETVGMYPQRPAASRGNAYLRPDVLSGEKRDRSMMFGDFDCKNAGGERMTQVPNTSDAPPCSVQAPPAWPPGNTNPYPHITPANYSKP